MALNINSGGPVAANELMKDWFKFNLDQSGLNLDKNATDYAAQKYADMLFPDDSNTTATSDEHVDVNFLVKHVIDNADNIMINTFPDSWKDASAEQISLDLENFTDFFKNNLEDIFQSINNEIELGKQRLSEIIGDWENMSLEQIEAGIAFGGGYAQRDNPLNDSNYNPYNTQNTTELLIPIYRRVDPLVLDLNGDGVNTIAMSDSDAYFDFDGDGFAEKSGWIDSSDAFLVLDKNGNGKVDDISELFGDNNTSGFDALQEYDSNADGVIDSSDEIYNQLQVWQDKNSDALTNEGEMMSLSEAGITSINLNATSTPVEDNENISLISNNLNYQKRQEVA